MKRFQLIPRGLLLCLSFLFCLPCLLSAGVTEAQTTPASTAKAPLGKPIKVAEKAIPAFSVWQLRSGESTESQVSPVQLNPSGYWLMLYIDIKSTACLDLLTQVQALASPALSPTGQAVPAKLDPAKLVIVAASATGAQLSQFQLSYPGLATSAWTHDAQSAAANALSVRGTPHLFGMHEGLQRWQYAGTPAPAVLPSMLTTWMSLNQQPKNKLTRNKMNPPPAALKPSASATPVAAGASPSAARPGAPR